MRDKITAPGPLANEQEKSGERVMRRERSRRECGMWHPLGLHRAKRLMLALRAWKIPVVCVYICLYPHLIRRNLEANHE